MRRGRPIDSVSTEFSNADDLVAATSAVHSVLQLVISQLFSSHVNPDTYQLFWTLVLCTYLSFDLARLI